MAPELLEQHARKCHNPDLPELLPPECRKRNYESEWKPEPKRVGMQGLLPYIRLGKRCVVGLGFFGCGVGNCRRRTATCSTTWGSSRPRLRCLTFLATSPRRDARPLHAIRNVNRDA